MTPPSAWRFLGLSLLGCVATGGVFLAVLYWQLPVQDLARRSGFWRMFLDPLVLAVALPAIIVAGLLLFPVLRWSLKRKRLKPAYSVTLAVSLFSTVALTPFCGIAAIPLSLFVVCGSLVLIRRSRVFSLDENERA